MVRHMFPQMVEGLVYLHSRNLVHRDVKPENVVVDGSDVAKLCDFGMMGEHGKRAVHGSGTTPYMAPELHVAKGGIVADKAHDIWALAVSLYVLLTGDFPWLKATSTDVEYAAFMSGKMTGAWQTFSPQLLALFRRMFAPLETRCRIEDVRAGLDIALFASSSSLILEDSSISMCVEDEGAQLDGRDVCGTWSSGMSNMSSSVSSFDVAVKIAHRQLHVVALDPDWHMWKDGEHVQVADSVCIAAPVTQVSVATKC